MRDTTATAPPQHGPALAAYIDALRGTTSARQFASDHGLDDARISAWRSGTTPTIDALRQVADALELTLGEVLVIAQLAAPEEFTLREPAADVPPSFATATAPAPGGDPELNEVEKVALRSTLDSLRAVANHEKRTARSRVIPRTGGPRRR